MCVRARACVRTCVCVFACVCVCEMRREIRCVCLCVCVCVCVRWGGEVIGEKTKISNVKLLEIIREKDTETA